jgi:hypothetical protein
MSKYKELVEKRAANHAICEAIDKELETIQPPELWVVFYKKEHDTLPTAHTTEADAKEKYSILQEKIVRYVLPETPLTDEPKTD